VHPVFVVCGVDRTGSYKLREVGLRLCTGLVRRGHAGDEFLLRWISDASFSESEFLSRIQIPSLPDCQRNPFDLGCRRLMARYRASLESEIQRISSQRPPAAPRTDIYGFLQAAADAFAAAPTGTDKLLYLATDLKDNVGYQVRPDLTGVRVRVLGWQTGPDPGRAVRLRARWDSTLRAWGAIVVTFSPAEVIR